MKVILYDAMASLPQDHQSNILVFGGKGSLLQADIQGVVTEIHCTHCVGDNIVRFLRNGNAAELRFERALAWAVKYAATHGVENIYGVFELDRSLDDLYLKKICPNGIIDRRKSPLKTFMYTAPVNMAQATGKYGAGAPGADYRCSPSGRNIGKLRGKASNKVRGKPHAKGAPEFTTSPTRRSDRVTIV